MITITSKAGQRLAKAKAELDKIEQGIRKGSPVVGLDRAITEYESAADSIADELIRGRHHEAEGD